jgi:hypothetical protein
MIDDTAWNVRSVVAAITGGQRYHCWRCRLQYFDWRRPLSSR